MAHTTIFLAILAFCVVLLVCAFRAENRAYEAEEKYRKLRLNLYFVECQLVPKFDKDDPEFLSGWNMAIGKASILVREAVNDEYAGYLEHGEKVKINYCPMCGDRLEGKGLL